jgi:integrase/recombinase XerD
MNKRSEYSFNKEIQVKLIPFRIYLQKMRNEANTIRQKLNYVGYFMNWMETERIAEAGYNDLLAFIGHCKETGKSKKHINSILRAVRNYYEHLKRSNEDLINPAANLHLKGEKQKLPHDLLSIESMEETYNAYPVVDKRTKRNKIILGIYIYQGITTDELRKLQTSHVNLQSGKIHIPGSRRSNSRRLDLKPLQILDLHEYLNQVRPELITEPTVSAEALAKADQLFISMEGNTNLKNSIHHLFRALKRINPAIRDARQIRSSVIVHWLNNYNLRQVQYMAGHKYVSSTERYALNNLEGLKTEVEKYHPL